MPQDIFWNYWRSRQQCLGRGLPPSKSGIYNIASEVHLLVGAHFSCWFKGSPGWYFRLLKACEIKSTPGGWAQQRSEGGSYVPPPAVCHPCIPSWTEGSSLQPRRATACSLPVQWVNNSFLALLPCTIEFAPSINNQACLVGEQKEWQIHTKPSYHSVNRPSVSISIF